MSGGGEQDESEDVVSDEAADECDEELDNTECPISSAEVVRDESDEQLDKELTDPDGFVPPTTAIHEQNDLGTSDVNDCDDNDDVDNTDNDQEVDAEHQDLLQEQLKISTNRDFLPHRDRDTSSTQSQELQVRTQAVSPRQMDATSIRQRVKQSAKKLRASQAVKPTRTKREAKQKTEKKRIQRDAVRELWDW